MKEEDFKEYMKEQNKNLQKQGIIRDEKGRYIKGEPSWSKGLTKETDEEIIKKYITKN